MLSILTIKSANKKTLELKKCFIQQFLIILQYCILHTRIITTNLQWNFQSNTTYNYYGLATCFGPCMDHHHSYSIVIILIINNNDNYNE